MSDSSDSGRSPAERVEDIPRVSRALRRAIREALQRHKREGHRVVVWRDGRVQWIPPEDIPDFPDPPEDDDTGNEGPVDKAARLSGTVPRGAASAP